MRKRRKYVQPRNPRQEAILEIFAEAQRLSGADVVDTDHRDGPILSPGLVKCPPWRAVNTRGELGPWYGPNSQTVFDSLMARFRESIYGGGLWDNDEVNPGSTVRRRNVGREDSDLIHAWMDKNSGSVPNAEMEIYISYFVNVDSLGNIARERGTSKKTVWNQVTSLRSRIKRGMPTRGKIGPQIRKRRS